MPHRNKRHDICATDAMGIVDQLNAVGHQVDVDTTDGLLAISASDGKQHSLVVDFSETSNVKVTSHIGNTRIDHPTLRAGVNTFVANVMDKDRKGIN